VSRVGGNAQIKAMKKIAGTLRLDLAAFRELEAFSQLGTDLDAATQKQLDRGQRMVELLKQPQYDPKPIAHQVISIIAGTKGYLDEIPVNRVLEFETAMLSLIGDQHPEFFQEVDDSGTLSDETVEKLGKVLEDCKTDFLKG